MKKNWNKDSFLLFAKVGAIICTSLAILSLSLKAYPETAETLSASIAGKKELPIYCVEKDKPQISLSFDAAWGNQDTRKILEVLKKNNVKVTFFMTGGWIEKYPEDVKAIAKDGHDLGNPQRESQADVPAHRQRMYGRDYEAASESESAYRQGHDPLPSSLRGLQQYTDPDTKRMQLLRHPVGCGFSGLERL